MTDANTKKSDLKNWLIWGVLAAGLCTGAYFVFFNSEETIVTPEQTEDTVKTEQVAPVDTTVKTTKDTIK